MKNATQMVREIRAELQGVEAQLLNHPYLTALERGEVPVEALRAFPGEMFHAVISDLRSTAMMVQRFGHTPARDFLNDFLQGEFTALDGLRILSRKLGMTQQDLERYEPTPEGFAYSTHLAWVAAHASAAEFVVVLLVTFSTWGLNCGRMGRALRAHHGFTEQETALLEGPLNIPPPDEAVLPIIQEGLDQGVEPRLLHRSARFSKAYEKMIWDAMLAAAGLEGKPG